MSVISAASIIIGFLGLCALCAVMGEANIRMLRKINKLQSEVDRISATLLKQERGE